MGLFDSIVDGISNAASDYFGGGGDDGGSVVDTVGGIFDAIGGGSDDGGGGGWASTLGSVFGGSDGDDGGGGWASTLGSVFGGSDGDDGGGGGWASTLGSIIGGSDDGGDGSGDGGWASTVGGIVDRFSGGGDGGDDLLGGLVDRVKSYVPEDVRNVADQIFNGGSSASGGGWFDDLRSGYQQVTGSQGAADGRRGLFPDPYDDGTSEGSVGIAGAGSMSDSSRWWPDANGVDTYHPYGTRDLPLDVGGTGASESAILPDPDGSVPSGYTGEPGADDLPGDQDDDVLPDEIDPTGAAGPGTDPAGMSQDEFDDMVTGGSATSGLAPADDGFEPPDDPTFPADDVAPAPPVVDVAPAPAPAPAPEPVEVAPAPEPMDDFQTDIADAYQVDESLGAMSDGLE